MLEAVTRFGTLHLRRQVLSRNDGSHLIPANAFLPSHEGILITRGVQEWACLLPQELPFASVARLLGWQAQEASLSRSSATPPPSVRVATGDDCSGLEGFRTRRLPTSARSDPCGLGTGSASTSTGG